MAKRRSEDPGPREEHGVVFPRIDGSRSTTATGRAVFADAAREVDPALAAEIEAEPNWHRAYVGHVRRLLEAEVRAHDPSGVPAAGLASVHRRFEFAREGEAMPVADAIERYAEPRLKTVTVDGAGAGEKELAVPYRGRELRGDALHHQLDRWVEAGTVERSFAEAIRLVLDNPDWLDLSDRTVAILGAGAEMGPLHALSRWNATMALVDVARPRLWQRILGSVRDGIGRALVPVRGSVDDDSDVAEIAGTAGCDLVTEAPEATAWLASLDGPLTVGNYVYADGADNVRVSVAADALIASLLGRRDDVSLAVLATPTDVFAVPEEAVETSRARLAAASPLARLARAVTGERLNAPNYGDLVTAPSGARFGVADAVIPQQGPNYVLAKRLHRWRARAARDAGVVSSVNVAPSTRTRSVTKNRVLAAAYRGAHRFGVEIFEPETSSALMAALLVHDLRNPEASAQPGVSLDHPFELFVRGAAHGGLWRMPYAARSVLPLGVVIGVARRR
ncbi:MAG: hypothetical protein ACRDUY_08445 [Nitriliruptorales bacterium]